MEEFVQVAGVLELTVVEKFPDILIAIAITGFVLLVLTFLLPKAGFGNSGLVILILAFLWMIAWSLAPIPLLFSEFHLVIATIAMAFFGFVQGVFIVLGLVIVGTTIDFGITRYGKR